MGRYHHSNGKICKWLVLNTPNINSRSHNNTPLIAVNSPPVFVSALDDFQQTIRPLGFILPCDWPDEQSIRLFF